MTTTNPLFYRWRDAMCQRVSQMPQDVFDVCYAALETGRGFTIDEIAEALQCDAEAAAHWHSVALVWLLDPALYTPLFEAEDQLADLRTQRTAYVLNVKETGDRLAALDEQIAVSKNYALLSDQHADEMQPKIAALDQERVDLLRHQERDLPRQQALLEEEECVVQTRLWGAQAAIDAAWEAQIDAVQAAWTVEVLACCEPIVEMLRRARILDEAAKALNRHAPLSGSLALSQAVVHRVQGQR